MEVDGWIQGEREWNLDGRTRLDSFFFFQAEDGIRDLTVTGVQTCALPIYTSFCFRSASAAASPWNFVRRPPRNSHRMRRMERPAHACGTSKTTTPSALVSRSEERRVGKECRSRWSPYH